MTDFWFDEFVIVGLLAGIGVALAAGPLGCVVVWRRMAYFGDTLAHAALLGVVLALSMQWLPLAGVVLTGVLVTSLLFWLERRRELSTDTLLGILSHSALAFGMIALALLQHRLPGVDVMSLLFGDILAVSRVELLSIYAGSAAVLALFAMIWRNLVALSCSEELARVDGVAVLRTRYLFMVLLAVMIAFAIKIVGVLLITALLIIPAATARLFAHSPLQMLLLATGFALVSVLLGFGASLYWDMPTGPAIVAQATVLFALGRLLRHAA